MGFKCGIVGLPNVGKSTIFNALTSAGAASENYPFCTIDPNIGRVDVPDPRMKLITSFINTQKEIPASMEFIDIAGLVKGASKGEGRGNQFLANIRSADAICHVVRAFENDDITHVDGSVDPLRDISTIEAELILSDYETVEKSQSRYAKLTKSGDKKAMAIVEMLKKLGDHLQNLLPARTFDLDEASGDMQEILDAYRDLHLISQKKVLYVCNVDEDLAGGDSDNEFTKKVRGHATKEGAGCVVICGKIEEELSDLEPEEKEEMIKDFGMAEAGLNRLIRAGYDLLGLQTYFTAGEKEVRAWTIKKGDSAPKAAGKIHSDFERGFICAEVYTISDLESVGSKVKLKENGMIRMEGRDYIVADGDVMEFRFNV